VASLSIEEAVHGDMKMNARATKLEAAENELKQLMTNVSLAMEEAQEAVGRIASQAVAATAETKSTTSSRCSAGMKRPKHLAKGLLTLQYSP
jgi:hypothetical protein